MGSCVSPHVVNTTNANLGKFTKDQFCRTASYAGLSFQGCLCNAVLKSYSISFHCKGKVYLLSIMIKISPGEKSGQACF